MKSRIEKDNGSDETRIQNEKKEKTRQRMKTKKDKKKNLSSMRRNKTIESLTTTTGSHVLVTVEMDIGYFTKFYIYFPDIDNVKSPIYYVDDLDYWVQKIGFSYEDYVVIKVSFESYATDLDNYFNDIDDYSNAVYDEIFNCLS